MEKALSTIVGCAAPRADDRIRTGDPHLGKVMLYQLSYVRMTRIHGSCRGRYWDRTSDLFRVKEARYPCANRPKVLATLSSGPEESYMVSAAPCTVPDVTYVLARFSGALPPAPAHHRRHPGAPRRPRGSAPRRSSPGHPLRDGPPSTQPSRPQAGAACRTSSHGPMATVAGPRHHCRTRDADGKCGDLGHCPVSAFAKRAGAEYCFPSSAQPMCGRSSVGRASPCQGEGRRFESGRPLHPTPASSDALGDWRSGSALP